MNTKIVPVRLSKRDLDLIDMFIRVGDFKDRSDFIRFSIKFATVKLLEKKLAEKFFSELQKDKREKK